MASILFITKITSSSMGVKDERSEESIIRSDGEVGLPLFRNFKEQVYSITNLKVTDWSFMSKGPLLHRTLYWSLALLVLLSLHRLALDIAFKNQPLTHHVPEELEPGKTELGKLVVD
ncbi:hypothetical protein Tco_0156518 [Tanacetum coccineum]